jgi:hypothetical protein
MKVFNKGERQYMIGDVLIKPQQTADIDDKYKSVVESYKEFEIVEPEVVVTTKAKKTSKKK